MFEELRQFVWRRNVLGLAVAVLIGSAAWSAINGLVNAFVLPLVARIADKQNSFELMFVVAETPFPYGVFIGPFVGLLLVIGLAAFVVSQYDEATKDCPHCLSTIPVAAAAGAFCARDVPVDDIWLEADEAVD